VVAVRIVRVSPEPCFEVIGEAVEILIGCGLGHGTGRWNPSAVRRSPGAVGRPPGAVHRHPAPGAGIGMRHDFFGILRTVFIGVRRHRVGVADQFFEPVHQAVGVGVRLAGVGAQQTLETVRQPVRIGVE